MLGDSTVLLPWVKATEVATLLSVGGIWAISTVVSASALAWLLALPSSTTQLIVRVGSAPSFTVNSATVVAGEIWAVGVDGTGAARTARGDGQAWVRPPAVATGVLCGVTALSLVAATYVADIVPRRLVFRIGCVVIGCSGSNALLATYTKRPLTAMLQGVCPPEAKGLPGTGTSDPSGLMLKTAMVLLPPLTAKR